MRLTLKQFAAGFMLTAACYSCKTLKPVAPESAAADIPKIVQPVSTIDVPVSVDMKSYIVQAENSVPTKFADSQQPCGGLRYSYTFTRTPFTITGSNNVVNLKFTGGYGISASYCAKCADLFGNGPQCIVPVLSAQCGMGGEAPRRMEIAYQSTISVLPNYYLKSKTILYPDPKPIDRCNIVFGSIDVTDRLVGYLKAPLNNLGAVVDAKIATFSLKPMFDQLWKSMSDEFKAGDVGFLNVNPQSVCLSSFSLNGSVLNFSVGLTAKPVVTLVSNRQPAAPLPALSNYTPANGFNIYLDLLENYDHLNNVVNQQVSGQTIKVAGNEFIVDNVKIYGIGSKIAMMVDFGGTTSGTIYLVATPTYDTATHLLSFPDLTFDLQTRAWMLKTAKWMFNGAITEAIKKRATYNCSKFIADSKKNIESQMSRTFDNGIHSDVTISNLDIMQIYPTAEKLIVRTLSTGQIKVQMKM
ncbi:MAG TPA: DUF4403 family protein [Mucilaginibacter sp.]|jgi:hypothetical protein|nr:DUF4403 family protein [Mucilaginibacter sp.]